MTVRRRCLEQVLLGTDETLQRHNHILTNRVDRGIGDLSKQLFEIIVGQSGLIGKTGERRVITHRPHRIPLFMHQGNQHEIEALPCIAKSAHTGYQGIGIEARDLRRHRKVRQFNTLFLEPGPVRTPLRQARLDLSIRYQRAFIKVDKKHAPRLKTAFVDNLVRCNVQYADLTRHDDTIIPGNVITTGSQSIAVQHGADTPSVGESHRRRTVPRLHHRRVIFIKRALGRIHRLVFLPSLRNHHENGFRQGSPRSQQKFQRIIQPAGIRTVRLNHREERRQVIPEFVTVHRAFTGLHPVAVTPEGIDLAIVGNQPHRVCPVPTGEGVSRKAGMHHREMAHIVRCLQIRKVIHQLHGAQHPFVDHDPTGE